MNFGLILAGIQLVIGVGIALDLPRRPPFYVKAVLVLSFCAFLFDAYTRALP